MRAAPLLVLTVIAGVMRTTSLFEHNFGRLGVGLGLAQSSSRSSFGSGPSECGTGGLGRMPRQCLDRYMLRGV